MTDQHSNPIQGKYNILVRLLRVHLSITLFSSTKRVTYELCGYT